MRKILFIILCFASISATERTEGELPNGVKFVIDKLDSVEWFAAQLSLPIEDEDHEIAQELVSSLFRGTDNYSEEQLRELFLEIGAIPLPRAVAAIENNSLHFHININGIEGLEDALQILSEFAWHGQFESSEEDQFYQREFVPENFNLHVMGNVDERLVYQQIEALFYPQEVHGKRIPIVAREEADKDSTFLRPGFSNRWAAAIHTVGDWLCEPWSWGLRRVVSVSDPHLPEIHEEMGQEEDKKKETIRRIGNGAVGGVTAVIGIPFAAIGQGLKIFSNWWAKEPLVHESGESTGMAFNPNVDYKIFSWNLAAMPSVIRRVNETRPVEIRMHEVADYLIDGPWRMAVCFQECFTDRAQTILYNRLKTKYPHVVHHVGQNVVGLNSGLMIMSPFKIVESRFEVFGNRRGENQYAQKGALGIVLRLDDNTYGALVTTHTESGGWGHEEVSSDSVRTYQVIACHELLLSLQEWIRSQGKEVAFGVLTGDMNLERDLVDYTGATDDERKMMVDLLDQYIEMEHTGPTTRGKLVTYHQPHEDTEKLAIEGNRAGRTRIDFADFLKGSNVKDPSIKVLYETGTMSDHFPVETTFQRSDI